MHIIDMYNEIRIITWDSVKNELNAQKNGVTFEKAMQAFSDPHRVITRDVKHSKVEIRYYCYGKIDSRVCTVRFVIRGDELRIIGAGYWRKEEQIYEKINNQK